MNLKDEAKAKTMRAVANELQEQMGDQPDSAMAMMIMSMHSIRTLSLYDDNLEELTGSVAKLLEAIENGGFTDENGTSINDTITFKSLKNNLGIEKEA